MQQWRAWLICVCTRSGEPGSSVCAHAVESARLIRVCTRVHVGACWWEGWGGQGTGGPFLGFGAPPLHVRLG